MTMYTKTGERKVMLGGLEFVIMHRELKDGDGGPTLEVFADAEGKRVMALKFDCFRKMPHYHAPGFDNNVNRLDPAIVGDGQAWVLARIREHLPDMIATAGYPALARSLDRDAFATGWTQVRDAIAESAPAKA